MFGGLVHTEAIGRDTKNAPVEQKAAVDTLVDCGLLSMAISIFDLIKKLQLGTFTSMRKKLKVNVKWREIQISNYSEILGNIVQTAQSRPIDLLDIFKYLFG